MTQYTESVERQKIKMEAEDWAKSVKSIHAHSLDSMHYDNRPEDTINGQCVTDTEFNSGVVERRQKGILIHTFGKKLTGQELIDEYERKT